MENEPLVCFCCFHSFLCRFVDGTNRDFYYFTLQGLFAINMEYFIQYHRPYCFIFCFFNGIIFDLYLKKEQVFDKSKELNPQPTAP